ncbi:hypothetical protein TTHT_1698 [Thermotomaculum hydrothermale]|uniref:PASTA domain-containing protein n=1 Tax=Thermotomaculum hydrothermale TaxID=981385 RepID=A0A7R6PN77_9BACT|nr:Stk1 family PASTA domain-containing Ser/Thr kinase [Thermotomaculum hydrothermale]BBB33172.1 hypothetical protein TTHT_1698 [Thermotomaculum hydrothermale]
MKKLLLYLLIITIGGFISFLSFWFTLRREVRGEIVKTPSVIGKSIDDAKKELAKYNLFLKVNTNRRVFSDYIEKGDIAIQIPEPGKVIKKGRKIEVIISKGSRRGDVPDVVGLSIEEASRKINMHGLKVSKIASVYSDKPEGIVIAQSPESGVSGIFNDKVKLLVSKGKKPKYYKVPDLRYKPLIQVEKILKKAGIQYVVKTFANQIRDERILFVKEQYPLPGYILPSDKILTLKVVMRENL